MNISQTKFSILDVKLLFAYKPSFLKGCDSCQGKLTFEVAPPPSPLNPPQPFRTAPRKPTTLRFMGGLLIEVHLNIAVIQTIQKFVNFTRLVEIPKRLKKKLKLTVVLLKHGRYPKHTIMFK